MKWPHIEMIIVFCFQFESSLETLINTDIKKNLITKFKKSNAKGNYKMELKNPASKNVLMIYND